MPRNMSFSITTEQVRNKTKTVTRRLGWSNLKVGEELHAVEKCQGLKKGEHVTRICMIRVVSVTKESLDEITKVECVKEGFPEMSPVEFVRMFAKHNHCDNDRTINRIEFEYL